MSGKTNIEWATQSWNPTVGCSRVSAGCDNCYAFEWHDRRRYVPQLRLARAAGYRTPAQARSAGVPLPFPPQYDVPFSRIQVLPGRLLDPDTWRRPQLVFVDSMADLFHEKVDDDAVTRVFDVMDEVERHIYFVLTKRPTRLADFVRRRYGARRAPAHIWVGTSVEDSRVLPRVDALRAAPAHVRFLSCEPLLGPLDDLDLRGISWVIAGGESGPGRRSYDPAWARALRDLCAQAGVAFFYKQGSAFAPGKDRELDGQTWNEYPNVRLRPTPTERRGHRSGLVHA